MEAFLTQASDFVKKLNPYEGGKPIEDVAREFGLDPKSIVKLASNENPLGPSPRALSAMKEALEQSHFYPDAGSFYLRQALIQIHGVDAKQLVFGCGSNELIELLAHAFSRAGETSIVASKHAFVVYKLVAQLFGAEYIEVVDKDYGHDLEKMLQAIQPHTNLVFVANPNNPTGTLLSNDELLKFIQAVPSHVAIVLDEAYYEFLDCPPPSVEWLKKHPNLILLRTFSKIYGLAGVRIGYGITSLEMAKLLERCRQPFNVTSLAQTAALASLEDEEHLQKTKKINAQERKRFQDFCSTHSIKYIPSEGNFVMCYVGDVNHVHTEMQKLGIIIRPLRGYHLEGWIRVSIGTAEQMDKVYPAMQKVLGLKS